MGPCKGQDNEARATFCYYSTCQGTEQRCINCLFLYSLRIQSSAKFNSLGNLACSVHFEILFDMNSVIFSTMMGRLAGGLMRGTACDIFLTPFIRWVV